MIAESFQEESKPHKCPEEIREDVKNKNSVCELFYDTRSGDECDKENDGNKRALKHHSCGDSGKMMIRGKSHDTSANGGLFYMDKNVTACDLPEIVVRYKESTYHVVKDICVDEGVPVHEKDSVRCNSEDLVETKSPEDRNGKLDGSELCKVPKTNQDVEESSSEGFADAESSSSCTQEHLIVTREAKGGILAREDEQRPLSNNENSHRSEEQSSSQLQENNDQRSLETELEETEEPRKAEEKLSSVSTTASQEPERPGTDKQRPDLLDDKLFSSGFGETSFSAAEAVSISGHISYSGPVVVSGRLSVRSDGSTTSGRSFAFPILQSEWNSSPERMAKAEKRRLKGWREILLCCRFS
ncbi:uncharacterized protein LOC108827188 isoform X2 [Raphanus sativus]|uniref:Uncharacterized protein LOC108827188 isoform X2 n=1 Tax=Raphanus sativus TaxID=3726 RepID=A0A6J0L751_RAPSA|nr:uncharacterized protein LOC108827188 isoform X2 [Raphanus sativus]